MTQVVVHSSLSSRKHTSSHTPSVSPFRSQLSLPPATPRTAYPPPVSKRKNRPAPLAYSPPPSPTAMKAPSHVSAPRKETRLLYLVTFLLTVGILVLSFLVIVKPPMSTAPDLKPIVDRLNSLDASVARVAYTTSLQDEKRQQLSLNIPSPHKRLLFYNRPPKTGSTSVRIAMKKALDEKSMRAAKCFNMIEWNEMGLKTIVNRRDVDFYGCHTRMVPRRYTEVSQMRGGNVTFMTNTRNPKNIILSAYLQANRQRNIADITDDALIRKEIEMYRRHVDAYPIDALYAYHGADVPLRNCPHEWLHEDAMRRVGERYEVVIDLERPQESAAMVEAVTGLKPDFSMRYNERTTDTSGKMLSALVAVDTRHKECGNELVHKVLLQQFNIIKDRLMQNRCFNEDSGSGELCDHSVLRVEELGEKSRSESYKARGDLINIYRAKHPAAAAPAAVHAV